MIDNIFNVRVYGILINESKEILVSDECYFGKQMTKFPGGGLLFGESTIDCIRREMMEEAGVDTDVLHHFYTTDFFQRSAFNENQQVIGIYYLIRPLHPFNLQVKKKRFDFESITEGAQIFRWMELANLKSEDFTFPIDQKVAMLLKERKSPD